MSRKRKASSSLHVNGHVREERGEWRVKDEPHDTQPMASASTSSTTLPTNWGTKNSQVPDVLRPGKIASWTPGRDELELQERARKRIRGLLPRSRSPSPPIPTLAHLRPPSPPHVAPYVPAASQHANFMAYVLDESVQHAYRSRLLPDLQRATCNLIEGESDLKRALGRFMAVLSDPPRLRAPTPVPTAPVMTNGTSHHHHHEDNPGQNGTVVSKTEDTDDTINAIRDDDMFPHIDKVFVTDDDVIILGHTLSAHEQSEHLLKALAALRDMQDDGREYVERLAEVREGLGELCYQRQSIWNLIRERALKEMSAETDS